MAFGKALASVAGEGFAEGTWGCVQLLRRTQSRPPMPPGRREGRGNARLLPRPRGRTPKAARPTRSRPRPLPCRS